MARGTCTVRWGPLSSFDERLTGLLDPVEAGRAATYLLAADRARFTLGVALLKLTASRQLAVPPEQVVIDRTCPDCPRPHGRPSIVGADLDVSVSHSGRVVAAGVCDTGMTGVDVERMDTPIAPRLAAAVLAPAEFDGYLHQPEQNQPRWFFQLWTFKEAVAKATGDGLRVPMAGIEVDFDGYRARLLRYPCRPDLPERVELRLLNSRWSDHVAAVVLPTGTRLVVRRADEALRAWLSRRRPTPPTRSSRSIRYQAGQH